MNRSHDRSRSPAASCCVVVVDDNVDAARTTALLMQHSGHEVTVFHDGESALASLSHRNRVYLIDIGLPDMSGLDLAKALRERTEGATLIALTGYGTAADRERSRHAGFDAHLVKPLDVAQLHRVMQAMAGCE